MQGSVVRSWLLELAGRAFKANGQDLEHLKGWVADSGEGRWTVQEAIDQDVPAPVITLSLLTRFRSRQDDSYGAKVLAALRNEFGGHAVEDRVGRAMAHRRRARRQANRPRPRRRPTSPSRRSPRRGPRTRRGRCASCARRARASARRSAEAASRTSCARASASSACPTRAILVLFGATGDLAHRKVIPALYQLWRTNLLPHEFVLLAIGRRRVRRRRVPGRDPGVARGVQPRPAARRGGLAVVRRADPLPPPRLRRPGRVRRRSRPRLDELDEEHGHARQPAVLPRDPAVAVRRDRRPARPGRPRPRAPRRRLAPGRHREAVRPRPRVGAAAEPRGRQGLPRVAGLPHRPLPGQGDRPQPAGLPVRQRHLRAALEPALRRPRPDHGGRVDRHREPRRVLRGDRRRRATSSRTTCSSSSAWSRWSRRRRSRPTRCATRRSRSCGRSAHAPRPIRATEVVRGQYGPGWVAGEPVPGYREEPEVDPESETETFVAARLDDRRLALVRRPVLRADRQAPAQARDRDRDPVPGGAAPPVPGHRRRARRRTCSRSASSPTRGSCCGSGPRSRASGSTSGR